MTCKKTLQCELQGSLCQGQSFWDGAILATPTCGIDFTCGTSKSRAEEGQLKWPRPKKTARAPFCSLAFLADFLQVAVDAGLRDAQRGGGAGHSALEHEHTVAVEVTNDVHAVALTKRRYV